MLVPEGKETHIWGSNNSPTPDLRKAVLNDTEKAQSFIDTARVITGKTNPFNVGDLFKPRDMLFISQYLGLDAVFALLGFQFHGHWALYLGQQDGKKLIYDLDSPNGLVRPVPEGECRLYLYPTERFLKRNEIASDLFIRTLDDGRKLINHQATKEIVLETLRDQVDSPQITAYRQKGGSTDCGPCTLYAATLLERNNGCNFNVPRSEIDIKNYQPYQKV